MLGAKRVKKGAQQRPEHSRDGLLSSIGSLYASLRSMGSGIRYQAVDRRLKEAVTKSEDYNGGEEKNR